MKKFKNSLTNINGTKQEMEFVLFPAGSTDYLILQTGHAFEWLEHPRKDDKANFPKFNVTLEWHSKDGILTRAMFWYEFYEALVRHCKHHRAFILPWEMFTRDVSDPRGFTCADPKIKISATIPIAFSKHLSHWDDQIYKLLSYKDVIKSDELQRLLRSNHGCGCAFILKVMRMVHPNFIRVPAEVVGDHLIQAAHESFQDCVGKFICYRRMKAHVMDDFLQLDNTHVQDNFVINTNYKVALQK